MPMPPTTDALLLVNLGTPSAPTARAVWRYLAEFLSDRRVVQINRLLWYPLLYGLIPVALTFHGAGQWSLDHALGWGAELSGLGWGLGVIGLAVLGASAVVGAGRHAERRTGHGVPTAS